MKKSELDSAEKVKNGGGIVKMDRKNEKKMVIKLSLLPPHTLFKENVKNEIEIEEGRGRSRYIIIIPPRNLKQIHKS